MQIKLEGKTCTLSVKLTRFKASLIMLSLFLIVGLPVHSCNNANEKLKQQMAQTNTTQYQSLIVEPIISPYELSADSKTKLQNWLMYGQATNYENMMKVYDSTNGYSETSKMFRYIIDTEWRLGHWDSKE